MIGPTTLAQALARQVAERGAAEAFVAPGERHTWAALQDVPDPEVPAVSVCDLGIVREVIAHDDGLEVVLTPIGFNWQIAIALVPGMAAREVAVGALGTVYALSAAGDDAMAQQLGPLIASSWSLATALSLLVWFVFAPQCISTLAMVKRETNGWRYPLIMTAYLFGLAYAASFVTYRVALALGGG